MHSHGFLVTTGLAAAFAAQAAYAGQHEGHQAAAAGGGTAAQVSQCVQAQSVVGGVINAALKRLEDARLTNSPAAMRDAADDVQGALLDVRAQLAPCAELETAAAEAQPGPALPTVQQTPAAPAPGAVDPHAGHVMPASPPAAPRTPAADVVRTPGAAQRPAAPDPHAGHVMPSTTAGPTAPSAGARSAAERNAVTATSGSSSAAAAAVHAPPTSITDLKCRSEVDPKTAPRMLYGGRMHYFCTEAERAEFAKNPARYVAAPAQATPTHAH